MDSKDYIEDQLNGVLVSSHEDTTYRLKINGAAQDTKWLSINREQLLAVVKALTEDK